MRSISLEAGDLVLFSRSCTNMDPFSAALCISAKIGSWSAWDHVGIVVPMSDGRLGIFEANLGGITLRSLGDRLRRTRSSKIAIRKLMKPKFISSAAMNQHLQDFAVRVQNKTYTDSISTLGYALLMSHASEGDANFVSSSA